MNQHQTPMMNRRNFLKSTTVSTAAITIIPRYVLGGPNQVPPSEKLIVALIGCGAQGINELPSMLTNPAIQMVAVCDPNKDSQDYIEWSRDSIRKVIANAMHKPDWRKGRKGTPGGREVVREMIEGAYAVQKDLPKYKGCAVYTDFRELLEKQSGLDAVKIMTPDHLHATIAIAAMRKGKNVTVHKPLANRVREARLVIETARQTKVGTHFLPVGAGDAVRLAASWIRDGAIGKLKEIHNWSNRPVWPQYATIPKETPPIPRGFNWDLWLGPSLPRPYHPHYTHTVFRGWYEFGGGSVADMGHYSLWPVFQEFDLDAPFAVESTPSHVCAINDNVSAKIQNDYSFPYACTIRFKFAAKGNRPALDLFWYDGGMRPITPEELEEDRQELEPEGMMFVGEQGKILAGFLGEKARLLPERKSREYWGGKTPPTQPPPDRANLMANRTASWVNAFRSGKSSTGDFLLAGPISEAFNLGAVSLRMGGKRLLWDAANMKITNRPEANKYLTREYRKGWELPG